MASTEDIKSLGQTTSHRTTAAPPEAFDASQFKLQIDEDVSSETIEHLQKEFGHDIAGAIDQFYDMKQVKPRKTTRRSEAPAKQTDEEADDFEISEPKDFEENSDPLGRKEFVVRDQYWDRYTRRYVLRKPVQSSELSSQYKRCVIFVRRVYDEDMTTFHTVLVVSGSSLRNALRNIFRGVDGFCLTDNESTELEPNYMFWAKPELLILARHYESVKDKTALYEINAALHFIEWEFERTISILPSLLPHSIMFEYLWALLPPDCLVVGNDELDFLGIWRIRSHRIQKEDAGIFLVMLAERVVWDGVKLGNLEQGLRIPAFKGIKMIEDLPYIPFKYHSQRDSLVEQILDRSSKALRFWQPDFQLQEHQGTGLAEVNGRIERYAFRGRVIIDPNIMRKTQPSNKIIYNLRGLERFREVSRVWVSDLISAEEESQILDELLKKATNISGNARQARSIRVPDRGANPFEYEVRYAGDRGMTIRTDLPEVFDDLLYKASKHISGNANFDQQSSGEEDNGVSSIESQGKPTNKLVQLSKEQMLLVSGLLYGYSLQEGTWGAFAVDQISDVTWNSTIFGSLVLEDSLKDIMYNLVIAHSSGASNFDDFVKGKGLGLIGLLFGPPGSGKTLTAEAIAETAQMPLYVVSSGALGHQAKDIHDMLSNILRLASHWKAVLLLDEADVFLAQRSPVDIERNALVSVFLRELEYYQGILLLTTNQAEVIDEAFKSRIHFSLQYPTLDFAARRKIWQNFLENIRHSKGIKVNVGPDDIDSLAKTPLNGRQIKNTISMAVKLATRSKSYTMTPDLIKSTAKFSQGSEFSNS